MDEVRLKALVAELAQLVGMATPTPPVTAPDEVFLPKTGHILPVAQAERGEMFVGYCQRVGPILGKSTGGVASLFLGTGHLGDGKPVNWPEMADKFYFPRAYMTAAQIAEDDANKARWAEYTKNLGQ